MDLTPTALPGVVVLRPRVFADDRGFFYESFHDERFAAAGLPTAFRQDNHSRSTRGVIRGLHYQLDRPQGKLVTCIRGSVLDVVVDIRVGSPNFGRWDAVTLSEDSPRYVWVPPGFAHGFCVTSDVADVVYKCTDIYAPHDQRGVRWSDPELGIQWPAGEARVSEKDQQYLPLRAERDDLPRYAGD